MLLQNVKDKKDINKLVRKIWTLWKNLERHFRTLLRFGAFYARDTKFQGAIFQRFLYQPWKFERSILLSSEELTGQNGLLKITKLAIFQSGSDISNIRHDIFYSRPIPTIPENFIKIRPRVREKSRRKNNNNNREQETEELQ